MEPQKRAYVLERLKDRRVPLPLAPFVVPSDNPEAHRISGVPFFFQAEMHWSGAAALQMIAAFYGREVNQDTLGRLTTPEPYPAFGTETWRENVRRVATVLGFGAMSFYPFRYLTLEEIVSNEHEVLEMEAEILKSIVAANQPVFVRLREVRHGGAVSVEVARWLSMVGHAVVVVGYDEEYVYLHDPWNAEQWGGRGGPQVAMAWAEFKDLWVDGCLGYMLLIHEPVTIGIDSIPTHPKAGEPIDLPVRFRYPAPAPFAAWAPVYQRPLARLEVNSGNGLILRTGQHPIKVLGESMHAGETTAVRWSLLGDQTSEQRVATVTFEAILEEPNAPFPYTSKVWQEVSVTLP